MPTSLPEPILQELVETRRDLHMHPEFAFQEVRTAGIVAERLRALGLEVRSGVAKTGVIGLLRGSQPGKTVLVRADMDCLAVPEENDIPYRSQTPGLMHACGHDGHTSVALTVARVLSERRESLKGNVKFVFQPAEEAPGGAEPMIREGALENPHVDVCLGLHLWNEIPAGQVGVLEGPLMAATGEWYATITGKGGHGAMPQATVDPVVAACHCVLALQTILSRNVDPLQPAVVTVGMLQAGAMFNVIPHEAKLAGTIRSYDPAVHRLLETRLRSVLEHTSEALGAKAALDYHPGYPVLVNDPGMCDIVRAAAADVVGEANVIPAVRVMSGEDMAYFLRERPGCFFFVGSAFTDGQEVWPHHNPRFNIDESSLPIAAQVMIGAVERCLAQ
ncbi:MAG TPA: amidohydrolase [Armatimonadota bacterium]|jgi:amidohydrolase